MTSEAPATAPPPHGADRRRDTAAPPAGRERRQAASGAAPDATGAYLNQIGQVDLLTAEEEVSLARDIEAGVYAQHLLDTRAAAAACAGPAGKRKAKTAAKADARPSDAISDDDLRALAAIGQRSRTRMIEANLRLVVSIARRHLWCGIPMLDLVQEGNVGVIRAVEKFDPETGNKFSTYASWWIMQAITRAIQDKSRAVRIPNQHHLTHNHVRRAAAALLDELGRKPTFEEIAAKTGFPATHVEDILRLFQPVASLDMPTDPSGQQVLADLMADPTTSRSYQQVEDAADLVSLATALHRALATLPDRDREVLTLRTGLGGEPPMSLVQAGARLGVGRETIRKIESRAMRQLRESGMLAGFHLPG